ncbi:serine-rich adhesin for platelets isoform X2 [Cebidichthys violaceus]|uniref:serine-rich adhesin for platelets isoform X2 n=1 Tax=Cebidichthys violaceus TaxID=271503 RepID=UPI0035CA3E65
MQLHACLLLFIITTASSPSSDKSLALLHHHCGGDVSLDKQPAGLINLTLPGLFTDTSNTLDPMNHQSDRTPTVSVCTWTIGVPLGPPVLLKVVRLDGGSSVVVRCVLNEGDRVLESGGTALLSHCDGNKATFTWTGAGRPSNEIQLSYYVQEDERNSSDDPTSPRSDQDLLRWSRTGTSFTSGAPVGRDVVQGADGFRGRLSEGLELSSGPQSASSPSSQDQGPLHPTSPRQGLTVAGRADRETLPLPEEEPNNGADTSGAAHLADGKMSARERARPYFQPTDSAFQPSHTGKKSSNELPQTQIALTHATAISSNTLLGTYIHKYTATQTSKLSTNTQARSSSRVPPLNSASTSRTTWESDTVLIPRDGAVGGASGEELPHSWRNQRSTDRLNSDLTSAVTSDPLKSSHTDIEPTAPSPSSSQASSGTHSSAAHIAELETAVGAVEAASFHPNTSGSDSSASAPSEVTSQTAAFESSDKREILHTFTSSTQSQRSSPESTEGLARSSPPDTSSPFTRTSKDETHTASQSTHKRFADTVSSSLGITEVDDRTLSFTGSSSTPLTMGDVVQTSAPSETTTETFTLRPTYTLSHDSSPTNSPTPVPPSSSSTSIPSSAPPYTPQTHTPSPGGSHLSHTPLSLPSSTTEFAAHTPPVARETTPSETSPHSPHTQNHLPLTSSTNVPVTLKQPRNHITTAQTSLPSLTTAKSDYGGGEVEEVEREDESWQWFPGSTTTQTPTAGAPSWTTSHPSQETRLALTPSVVTSAWSPTNSHTPKFYIVPDQPSVIRVESIELLLQIVVEESRSAFSSGLEEETAAWVEPYLQKAPGFIRLLGVWSSGHAVQSLVEFRTSGALRWLGMTGPASLLERTGLAQAVCEGRSFRSSKITNITLGGLQGDVCDWLLQCPAGYKCVFNPGTSNYSCSSVCRFDFCHHHGICTHHPGQLPVCRCLVGEDFWYMGQRCDVRMTRARLVGACLAILLVMVTVIGVLALVAVRRYRAILIQAKVDQTRSSYRRFNHFDELSGRFWLRSWAGSADSLDNPAFTRSDELLHLQALDRACCYHDDTLSLASTCPSHGARINTIYPHSSQYGWRGSEMSMGDGVLDSGKASDLSVCSWPVEPIQWTPFPLLQKLASQRTPPVRVSRPRSYCEGMELVDLGKSWTA